MKAERFVWTAIVQLLPFVGIDMIHHPGHISLCQVVETGSFSKNPPDQLMVDLNVSLLVRAAGVTIIDACSAKAVPFNRVTPVLDFLWVREFAAVVRYDHGKQPVKQFSAKAVIKPFEDIDHGPGSVGITQKSQH